jgi:hypothetical protein
MMDSHHLNVDTISDVARIAISWPDRAVPIDDVIVVFLLFKMNGKSERGFLYV